jgi:biopolymer transport protein ExbD
MRLPRPEPRPQPETIVALIDVVFFLLVFFMIVGRMDATAPFELAPPIALGGQDMPAGGATVTIAPDARLALDGRELDAAALVGALADRLAAEPGLLVRVNAHHAARLGDVLPLVTAIEGAGARDVALVVTPERR